MRVRSLCGAEKNCSGGADSTELSNAVTVSAGETLAAIGIYNLSETANPGKTSIRFTDFKLTGGSPYILSDSFDCDNVP